MSLLNALYVVQLLPTSRKNFYNLHRISKQGNCPTLNKLLAWKGEVEFKKLEPSGMQDDYLLYPVSFGEKNDHEVLMMETAPFLYPYGVVNTPAPTDCILFRISEDLTIEFFVSESSANLTAQLLTMLLDGSLSEEINKLTKQVDYVRI